MAGRLQPMQHHDLDQVPDMQARRRRIIADIGRHDFLGEQLIEAGVVGRLMDETAFLEGVKEIGLELGHDLSLSVGCLMELALVGYLRGV